MKEKGMEVDEELADGQRVGRPSEVGGHLLGHLIHRLTRVGHAPGHGGRALVVMVTTATTRRLLFGHEIGRHDSAHGVQGHLVDGLVLHHQVKELQDGAQAVPVAVVEDEHQQIEHLDLHVQAIDGLGIDKCFG